MLWEEAERSLYGRAQPCDSGVPSVNLPQILERLGGQIDLLKLDVEGSEWPLLLSEDGWEGVRNLTMEYHLWARQEMRIDGLVQRVCELGFRILHLHEHSERECGLLVATRS